MTVLATLRKGAIPKPKEERKGRRKEEKEEGGRKEGRQRGERKRRREGGRKITMAATNIY